MDLTDSYLRVIPADVVERYAWAETRNAAAIMAATNPLEFGDLLAVLTAFKVDPARDVAAPGGNESATAALLNRAFRARGWREASYQVSVSSVLRLLPWPEEGETDTEVVEAENDSTSYLVDNVKGRLAVDVEWHAKDGNLDRDVAAYRSLHGETIIDAAALITMVRAELRAWAVDLDRTTKKFSTSTTTNIEKLLPRLRRGDGGGCPILVAAVGRATT